MAQLDIYPYLMGNREAKQRFTLCFRATAEYYRNKLDKYVKILDEDSTEQIISISVCTDYETNSNQQVSLTCGDLQAAITENDNELDVISVLTAGGAYINVTVEQLRSAFSNGYSQCAAASALFTTMANTAMDKAIDIKDYLSNLSTLTKETFFAQASYYTSLMRNGVTPRELFTAIGSNAESVTSYSDLIFSADSYNDSNVIIAAMIEVGSTVLTVLTALVDTIKKLWNNIREGFEALKAGLYTIARAIFPDVKNDFVVNPTGAGVVDIPFASLYCSSIFSFSQKMALAIGGRYSTNRWCGCYSSPQYADSVVAGYFRKLLIEKRLIELAGSGFICRIFTDDPNPHPGSGVYIYFYFMNEVSYLASSAVVNNKYNFAVKSVVTESTNESVYEFISNLWPYIEAELTVCPWSIHVPTSDELVDVQAGFDPNLSYGNHYFINYGSGGYLTSNNGSADFVNALKFVNFNLDNVLSTLFSIDSDQYRALRLLISWVGMQMLYLSSVELSDYFYNLSNSVPYYPCLMVTQHSVYDYDDIFLPYNSDSILPTYVHVQSNEERASELSKVILSLIVIAIVTVISIKTFKAKKKLKLKAKLYDRRAWIAMNDYAGYDGTDKYIIKTKARAAVKAMRKSNRINALAAIFGVAPTASVVAASSLSDALEVLQSGSDSANAINASSFATIDDQLDDLEYIGSDLSAVSDIVNDISTRLG